MMDIAEIVDMIRQWRLISHSKIDLGKEQSVALIKKMLIPATGKEIAVLVARLLQHFPSRQTERDAALIGDISFDLQEVGVSSAVLYLASQEIRQSACAETPFLPSSGDILRCCTSIMEKMDRQLKIIEDPSLKVKLINCAASPVLEEKKVVPWYGLDWKDLSDDIKDQLRVHIKKLDPVKRENYLKYLANHMQYPLAQLISKQIDI